MSADSLEASVEVSGCTRHDGFNEERLLLPVALLVASDDAEAPALVVDLLQDDVSAPVHVTTCLKRARVNFTSKQNKHS